MSIPRNNQSEKMHGSASTLKEKERMSKGKKIGKGLLTRQLTDHSTKMSMQRSARPTKTSYRWHLRALAKALANRPLAGPKGSTRDVTCARYPPFLRRSQKPPAKFSACVYVERCACACVRMCTYVCVAKAKMIGIVKINRRDRGESLFRGPMTEASRITVRTYVLVAEQMACDWHPRSATRPRAANAANSRRSLARRSTHPHPHPHPRSPPPTTRWSFPSFVFRRFPRHILSFFDARRREESRIFIPCSDLPSRFKTHFLISRCAGVK